LFDVYYWSYAGVIWTFLNDVKLALFDLTGWCIADSGYGAKAHEIIGQVRVRLDTWSLWFHTLLNERPPNMFSWLLPNPLCRGSRHDKTKMKCVGGAVHWSCCRRPLRPAALAFFDCDLSCCDGLLLRLHVFRR
jgi:hypothetical protein